MNIERDAILFLSCAGWCIVALHLGQIQSVVNSIKFWRRES